MPALWKGDSKDRLSTLVVSSRAGLCFLTVSSKVHLNRLGLHSASYRSRSDPLLCLLTATPVRLPDSLSSPFASHMYLELVHKSRGQNTQSPVWQGHAPYQLVQEQRQYPPLPRHTYPFTHRYTHTHTHTSTYTHRYLHTQT